MFCVESGVGAHCTAQGDMPFLIIVTPSTVGAGAVHDRGNWGSSPVWLQLERDDN